MIYRIVLLLFFCSYLSIGQNIEIAGGLSKYDYSLEDENKFSNSAITDVGFGLYFGINDVQFGLKELENVNFRFTIGISKSAAKFQYRSGGLGGGVLNGAETNKTVVALGVYPFNFKLFKHIDINIGVKWLHIISSTVTGNSSEFGQAGNSEFENSNSEDVILATNQIGPTGRIAYVINLTNKTSLTPQYIYYLGLGGEFKKYISTKSRQNHFIGIGLQTKI